MNDVALGEQFFKLDQLWIAQAGDTQPCEQAAKNRDRDSTM
ncbi:hypothetical protein [Microbulbifer agarilyticus]|nr:hypothetical protein [Microbulbifer agarilyticus]